MIWLIAVVILLVAFGSFLAVAEASITRMTRVRALTLIEEGRRNAALLERIENDPPPYLNSIYLSVLFVQNGSAILVAILAQRYFGEVWITVVSLAFALLYFVVVEAMSKTFAILNSDRAALTVAPVVWFLGRVLAYPTRLLIGLANVLLPGKGIKQGPFATEEEIRSMAEVGHEEGAIEEDEKRLIHSIFEFGDTIVREVMVPRPNIVAIEQRKSLRALQDLVLKHGFSRVPVYREDLDSIEGIVYAKDVLKTLHQGRRDVPIAEVLRPAYFVPETKKVSELLREMQQKRVHIAVVVDEYGSTAGLVTLEDLLEELVGEIADEYDREEPLMAQVGNGSYRVDGRMPIDELSELLEVELPHDGWDTVGGLMLGLLGAIPHEGQKVSVDNLLFTAERVQRRRVQKVLVSRQEPAGAPAGEEGAEAGA